MRRRDFMVAAGAVATTVLTRATVAGGAEERAKQAGGSQQALADVARACVADGDACLEHCLTMFKSGDTSLAACAQSVAGMIPACTAMAKLATLGAAHIREFAAACRAICEDCEKECRKHASVHPVCKACADSCARFVNEASKLTAA